MRSWQLLIPLLLFKSPTGTEWAENNEERTRHGNLGQGIFDTFTGRSGAYSTAMCTEDDLWRHAVAAPPQSTYAWTKKPGCNVAKLAADVVLMQPSLFGILTMINISKKAIRRIKFNFSWSFVYNLLAALLSASMFMDARIQLEFAGSGELVIALPVVVVAVHLRWSRV